MPPDQPRVLVDGWYSWVSELPAFTSWLEDRSPLLLRLSWRSGVLRGLLVFLASLRHDVVAAIYHDRGWRTLLLLRGLLGRRPKLVAFHVLARDPRHSRVGRGVDRAWMLVERALTARALRAAQVLTDWEREPEARRLRLSIERVHYVPFAWRTFPAQELPEPPSEDLVVSIGRAFCDWPTVFEAAEGAAWPLVVACAPADLATVTELNRDGRATVLCDIPEEEALALLHRATVSVISMYESERSQGHVRLKDVADAAVPLVATATASLGDYLVDGRTALLVPPGDADGLRSAVDRLLADPGERDRLRRAAFERSQAWTWSQYMEALGALVYERPINLPAP